MINERYTEIIGALEVVKAVSNEEYLAFLEKNEDKSRHIMEFVSNKLMGALYEYCPPGYEIDR